MVVFLGVAVSSVSVARSGGQVLLKPSSLLAATSSHFSRQGRAETLALIGQGGRVVQTAVAPRSPTARPPRAATPASITSHATPAPTAPAPRHTRAETRAAFDSVIRIASGRADHSPDELA
jgi:hypothetical protein